MITSKQALEKLKIFISKYSKFEMTFGDISFGANTIDAIVQLEKDLDILEIIKKGFSKNFLAERLRDAYLRGDLNDEDYETILNWEWLK